MRGVERACYLGLALLMNPLAAPAQSWEVDVSAGAAEYDAVAGDVGTFHGILSVRRQGTHWVSLSAGAPLDSAAIPWVAAGGGTRLSRGLSVVELGADLAAMGFGYDAPELDASGGGATLVGLPFVGFDLGNSRVEVRSGALHHTSFFDGESSSRTVFDGGVRVMIAPAPRLLLEGEGRVVRDGADSYPFVGLEAELLAGPATLWVRGGRWLAEPLDGTGWGLGARVPLPAGLVLRASFERDTDDPLYWNGQRSGWTVGLSRTLGARRRGLSVAPGPASFQREAGTVVLRLPIDESVQIPSIAGDFTGWKLVPMRRGSDAWEATFDLAPGIYHYSFVGEDGTWFLPESVRNRAEDGFGGSNAVLVVSEK